MIPFSQGDVQLNGMGGPDDEIVIPPPGDPASGIPLVENGNPAWNNFLQYVPEDKRVEAVPVLKEWDKNYNELRERYKGWDSLVESGVTPELADNALNITSILENNPHQVYETLGKYLGITPKEAKAVVDDALEEEGSTSSTDFDISQHPHVQKMQQQLDTLAQIALAQRDETMSKEQQKAEDAKLEQELTSLKSQHGDFPEDEVVMRMLHKGMSAEDALTEYKNHISEAIRRRPAPFVLGGGTGTVPRQSLDVTKLDAKGTKDLVAQTLMASLDKD